MSSKPFKPAATHLFLDLLVHIHRHGDMHTLAEQAGVHVSTLRAWCYGPTLHPRINTMFKVAGALGFDIALRPARKLRAVA